MQHQIKKVCVIGSGVMGSGIAALVANASCPVVMLDMPGKDPQNRNQLLQDALNKIKTTSPAALSHPDKLKYISIGNLEDNPELISDCDLVIEVIIERIDIKRQLYNRIIPYLHDRAILASNTSTYALKQLKSELPEDLKRRFMITHFFNPPRYMQLLELVTDKEVDRKYIDMASNFITDKLGKTIVPCNDTPGFIANRIGCFLLELTVREAINLNLDPGYIDRIFSKNLSLPDTGIFGLYDLIGHDVMQLISVSLLNNLPPDDDYRQVYKANQPLEAMAKANMIGRKAGSGFYRLTKIADKKVKEVINFQTLSYQQINLQKEIAGIDEILAAKDKHCKFMRDILVRFYSYLCNLIPQVTDDPKNIDAAMRLGYGWKYGPFELLTEHLPQFLYYFSRQTDAKYQNILDILQKNKDSFKSRPWILNKNNAVILENKSAQLIDYQNRLVFCLNSKMGCFNHEIFNLIIESVDYAEKHQQDLIIHSNSEHFSAGADLNIIYKYVRDKNFIAIENLLKLGQTAMLKLKYAKINIIICAKGVALGGGCEMLLHSDFITAHTNLRSGLVELGIGVIPAWGGTKEMILRSKGNKDILIRNIANILNRKQSLSADYFIADYGISNCRVIMNRDLILAESLKLKLPAKQLKNHKNITLPTINLREELKQNYTPLEEEVLNFLQQIIDRKNLTESELLDLERQKFLELAQDPQVSKLISRFI